MKKIINIFSLIAILVCSSLVLSSCGHKHNYTEEIIKPTCIEQGYTRYNCECGDTYTSNEVEATGHSFTNYVSNEDSTCQKDGTKTAKCDNCDVTDTITVENSKSEHNYDENGYCTICSYNPNASVGLSFDTNQGNYAMLIGIGSCTDENIVVPKVFDGKPVTRIFSYALANLKNVKSIVIPDSVTEIGTFQNSSIESIIIPDSVTEISSWAFKNCNNLTSIIIPNGVTKIKECAFEGCSSLTSIVIPNTVTEIGYGAFKGCSSLTSISIPETITKIADYTFQDCTSLKSFTISSAVTEIGESAFNGCTSLTNINLPSGVTVIEDDTFSNCTSLTSITIPDSVTEINYGAFSYCTSLTTIDLPNNITKIAPYLFRGCTSLETVEINENITTICTGAFMDSGIKNIVIPNTVTSIESNVFKGCTSIESLSLPFIDEDGDNHGYLSYYFGGNNSSSSENADCVPDSLKEIIITDGTIIDDWAFNNCSNIESITLSKSITEINAQAFINCTSLKNVAILNPEVKIHKAIFQNCNSLESITMPLTANYSGSNHAIMLGYHWDTEWDYTQDNSKVPTTIKHIHILGSNITTKTFNLVSSLESVIISNTITYIGSKAFFGTSIKNVYYAGTIDEWNAISKETDNYLEAATKHFYSETEPTDTSNSYWHYDADGITPILWEVE